ncbi:disulfide bond formation protein B [Alcaligenaceae bacterium 429]|uniref:disulfide bond formation protein B n=1 Tax=Paenalcaligenes sp. Me52 TaxID=3392038 RepID=UPI001093067B|nr:disulfide bond formation protein B [Alcaligenaceae bacterium 429]
MNNTSTKLLFLLSGLCFLALAIALVSQHMFGMRPCAWCVLQRLMLIAVGVGCLFAGIAAKLNINVIAKLLTLLSALLAASGIWAAWHQYSVASLSFSCDQTLADRIMTQSGLESQFPSLFGIYATCMDARVELLGVEYALWGMGLFAVCVVALLYVLFKKPARMF